MAPLTYSFSSSKHLPRLTFGTLEKNSRKKARWLPAQESTAFALAQVLVDIFILSPLYALSFIVTTGLLEGKSVDKEILRTVRDDYPPLVFWLVVVGLILAPLHIYLFNRFSLKWRVLISDGIDLLWTVIACFVIEPT